MNDCRRYAAVAAGLVAAAGWLPAQKLKPETMSDFFCYVQSAENRMAARKTFLALDASPAQIEELMRSAKAQTVPGSGENPHKIQGAMLYDWVGTIFIPGATLERTVRMVQDYEHRPEYFPEVVASAKLQCRTGENRFGFTMRIKEPTVADSENDVVWERVDQHRWKCRSYSGDVRELKPKNYLHRLNSYWRFYETPRGVFVEGETITLSGEFGSFMRTLGSLAGVNPEKSLKRTLTDMRESVLSKREFHSPPTGLPQCGQPVRIPGCPLQSNR